MELNDRLHDFEQLGIHLLNQSDSKRKAIELAYAENSWFIPDNSAKSLSAIANQFLSKSKLESFVSNYKLGDLRRSKKVGIISAGNIPLVGFHDVLCTLLCRYHAFIKLSSKDSILMSFVLDSLKNINPAWENYIHQVDQLKNLGAYIATGSNNTAKYFEQYFATYPHIIRRNRNSIAILSGDESTSNLIDLGHDVFSFFGMGCRNVSKLYVPRDYNFEPLLSLWQEHFAEMIHHNGYKNNYDYNYTIYLMNKVPFLMNGCTILLESESLASRIACLHFEYYDSLSNLEEELELRKEEIQCVVTKFELTNLKTTPFGKAQSPALKDFADGIDTMNFLISLSI
jgi:hypothetical protein